MPIIGFLICIIKMVLSDICGDEVKSCNFEIPKSPAYNAVTIAITGLSQSECLDKINRFDWAIGLYCESSSFCGLGFDDTEEQSTVISSEVTPVSEVCHVFVNWRKLDCGSFKEMLYDIGIIKGTSNDFFPLSDAQFTHLGNGV